MDCPKCKSPTTILKGTVMRHGIKDQRYKCKSCNHNFYESDHKNKQQNVEYDSKAKRLVVTSAVNGCDVNYYFLSCLENYAHINDAKLMIIPQVGWETELDSKIHKYVVSDNIKVHKHLKILGGLSLLDTSIKPLSGLDSISKGDSVIVGHSQVQLKTLPVQVEDRHIIMTTTGSITNPDYKSNKIGIKAEFQHSLSAVIVEFDADIFHIRHLHFDKGGFYDLEHYYTSSTCVESPIEAIVTGDEHAIFIDPSVESATYGKNGIVDSLKPSTIVRHDVLDCFAISHHHKNSFLTKYKKKHDAMDSIKDEMDITTQFILDTTPKGTKTVIVPSNHTDHLTKWLNECDPKLDLVNAKTYHWLMFRMLHEIDITCKVKDPFELWASPIFKQEGCDVRFISRNDSYKLCGIELAAHGDKGVNGSKGTRLQFANLPSKTIIGHSHSPGIEGGCYQTGTSSTLQLEYNVGLSSWMNTHCIIYKNGTRTLINIINGKWKL